jgi:hypothetical protein
MAMPSPVIACGETKATMAGQAKMLASIFTMWASTRLMAKLPVTRRVYEPRIASISPAEMSLM